jgi:Tfp pilus assembly protein FimV
MRASNYPTPRALAVSVTRLSVELRRFGAMLILVTVYGAVPTPSHAAQNAAVAVQPPAPAVAPMASTYSPKPSETLDQVIARTLPDSPLRIELLRQAFVSQNPQAIVPGKVPKLRKGVPLTVPDHDELIRRHLGSRIAPVEVAPAPPQVVPSTNEERKRWVQFP